MTLRRWSFADQLGPHCNPGGEPLLLVESRAALRRRPYHRQKLHLILSALRHRAAELPSALLVQSETYADALAQVDDDLVVNAPTSRAARAFVGRLHAAGDHVVRIEPAVGFSVDEEEFATWAAGRKRLRMEDFYRTQRVRHGLLLEGDGADPQPVGGTWNLDHDNREPPPGSATLGVAPPYSPREDEIDEQVRADLDRWERDGELRTVGVDGPRQFAVTRREALAALDRFLDTRLATFGPYEDAMLAGDDTMSHSLLSVPLNLGLLHPVEVAEAAVERHAAGEAPLASVEGFVRQVVGWREWVWQLYWHLGPDHRGRNALDAHVPLPAWFADLRSDEVDAACLSDVLRGVRDHGWVHHIPRLMVLGSWALQRGYDPDELTTWFQSRFVDGFDWVMPANVVGMSQHADGGQVATKPYTSGGAYVDKMSDYCGGCRYDPKVRVGEDACPFTAGYWYFLDRNADRLQGNHRLARPLQQRHRLKDLDALVEQERARADDAP